MAITPANTDTYIDKITLPTGSEYPIVDMTARQTIDAMTTTITSISSNLNSVSGRVNSVSSTVNSLSSTVKNLATTITSVSSNLNSLSGTVKNLATTITSVSSNLNSLSSTVKNISTTVNSLSSTVHSMSKYSAFLGVVSNSAAWTKITDGSTTATILVGSTTTTVTTGNIVIYKPSGSTSAAQEFIWNGSAWSFFGDISAENLKALAYKDSASSTVKFLTSTTIANTQTAAISVSVSYTPTGSVAVTNTGTVVSLSTTSTAPSSSANYWVYNPADNLSITASAPGTGKANFLTSVTGRSLVSSITIAAPTSSAPTGGISYASVTGHILQLNYLVPSTQNAISGTATAQAVTSVSAPTINKKGTTRYVAPVTVTHVTKATFTGTAATITSSGAQKIASISSSSSTVTVS